MVTYFQSKDLKTQLFGIGNYLDFKETGLGIRKRWTVDALCFI